MECLICYEKQKIKALTQCGHQALCIICCLKKRTISKNNNCLACTQESHKVIATNNPKLEFQEQLCQQKYLFEANIFAPDDKVLEFCKSLLDIQCSYQNCLQKFYAVDDYKQHLQDQHRRYLCKLCLKHSTLLIPEQKLYRQQELYQHLQIGDEDGDGTLINKHPYCQLCQTHFFDEDKFLRHMHEQHYKCHICDKIQEKRFLYYKDYNQLDQHFQKSHYPCRDLNCIAAKFIVFKNQPSLQKHMNKVHGIKIQLEIYHDEFLKDDLGLDIKDQLLSQIKSKEKKNRQQKDYKEFEQQFQRIQLFSILGSIKERSVEEEKKIIYAFHHPHSDEFFKYQKLLSELFFENVKFDLRQENSINFEIFLNMISDVVSDSKKNNIRGYCYDFIKNQIGEHDLFNNFLNIFSPVLAYKYFYLYSLCCNLNNQNKLQDLISANLYQIPFKITNILSISTSWKQAFSMITQNILETIFDQIKSGRIDLRKPIKVSSQRIYQMMRELNTISLKDLIKLRYLRMFFSNQVSLQIIRQTFICSLDYIQRNLQKINPQDLIISFFYFNTTLFVFENQSQITIPRKINPDIIKLFMRHFPDLSTKIEFPILSEDEDYDQKLNVRKDTQQKNFDKSCIGQTKYMRKQFIFDKKDQGTNPIELDPEFDFPQLQSDPKDIGLPKNKKITQNIFKTQKNIEDEFPSLLQNQQQIQQAKPKQKNILNQDVKKQKKQKVQQSQKKLNIKEDFPSLGNYQNTDEQILQFQKQRVTEISTKKKYINIAQNNNLTKQQFPSLQQQLDDQHKNSIVDKRQKNIEELKFRGKNKLKNLYKYDIKRDNKLQENLKKRNQKITIYDDEEQEELNELVKKKVNKIDLKDLALGKQFNASNDKLIKDPQQLQKPDEQQNYQQLLKEEDFPSAFPNLEADSNLDNIFERKKNKKTQQQLYEERYGTKQQTLETSNTNQNLKEKKKNKKKNKKIVIFQLN